MKNLIKSLLQKIGHFIGRFLYKKTCLRIYNHLFENLPYQFVKFCVKYIPFPDLNFLWKIKLLNGKSILTQIERGNLKTLHFALSYKWHSPSLNLIEKLLNDFFPQNALWIDIGANLGLRSLIALSENRKVFLIEPNTELNKLNKERCKLNDLSNYMIHECGASDQIGEVTFFIDKSSFNSTIEADTLHESTEITKKLIIETNTIDNLFSSEIEKSGEAYLKIDVEGHELKTLLGATSFLEKVKPVIVIEVNDKGQHFRDFLNLILPLGYQVFEIGNFKRKNILKEVNIFSETFLDIKYNDFLLVQKTNNRLEQFLKKHIVNS